MASKSLAVVGMRRSGTSSVCQYLHSLGVSFGRQDRLISGDHSNENGYWENKDLIGIFRRFRSSLNLHSVDCDPLPNDWRDRPATEHFLNQAAACLRTTFLSDESPWAWKDPDSSLALPFVDEVNHRLGVTQHTVICVRNPRDVALSELKRKGTPMIESVGAWIAHTLFALRDSEGKSRSIVLFSNFVEDPQAALVKCLADLEIVPSKEMWRVANLSLRKDLIHSSSESSRLDEFPILVQQVYELCEKMAFSPEENHRDELERSCREFDSFRRMFSRPAVEEATVFASWTDQNQSWRAESSYRVSGGWQQVSVEVGAASGHRVEFYFYPLPANIWIRGCRWQDATGESSECALLGGGSANLQNRFGLVCLSLLHGPDQAVAMTPVSEGPFVLELEFLVDANNLNTAETYKFLSEAFLHASASQLPK